MDTTIARPNNEPAAAERSGARGASRASVGALTVEHALYGVLSALALLLRLADLGAWPLLAEELGSALAAWGASGHALPGDALAVGATAEAGLPYVPLLYAVNLLTFSLLRASDALVRLAPALAGAGLVWLPYGARDILGRRGAPVCALLLAISPTWVFLSRSGLGSVPAVLLTGWALLAIWRQHRSGATRGTRAGAVAAGLALASGPLTYSVLLGAGLALGVATWVAGGPAAVRAAWRAVREFWDRRNLALAGGTFILVASAGLVNPAGVGVALEALGAWWRGLAPASSGLGARHLPLTLLLYEPLTLALTAVGAGWAVARRSPAGLGLLSWALLGLLLGVVFGQRHPIWLPGVLLPMVLLAGLGAEAAWRRLARDVGAGDALGYYGGVVLLGLGLVSLAHYVRSGAGAWQGYALVAGGALVLGGAALWLWFGARALRVALALLLTLLLGVTVRATTALAYQTGRDPRELLVVQPTSVDVRDLQAWVERLAVLRVADPRAYAVRYEPASAPWMAWYLREDTLAAPLSGYGAADPAALALVTLARAPEASPAGYVGQTFRLRESWDWAREGAALTPRDRLRWYLYRDPVGTPQTQDVQLWARTSLEQ